MQGRQVTHCSPSSSEPLSCEIIVFIPSIQEPSIQEPSIQEIDPADDYAKMKKKLLNLVFNIDYLRKKNYNDVQILQLQSKVRELVARTNQLSKECGADPFNIDYDQKIIIMKTFQAIAEPNADTYKALRQEAHHYRPIRTIAGILLNIASVIAVVAGLNFSPMIWPPAAGLVGGFGLFYLATKAYGEDHKFTAGKIENIIRPVALAK